MKKQIMISIEPKQEDWLKVNHIKPSALLRDLLDKHIKEVENENQ